MERAEPREGDSLVARALCIIYECQRSAPESTVWDRFIVPRLNDGEFSATLVMDEVRAFPPESFALGGLAVACAFAVEAMRATKTGNREAAWNCLADASLHLGAARVSAHLQPVEALTLTARDLGRRGGLARHRETRAMEKETRAWCLEHLDEFSTLDELTDGVIAARINPMPKATTRRWVTGFAKEWRQAGLWVR